jgi:hypothetical protein
MKWQSKSRSVVMASCNVGSSAFCDIKKRKEQLRSLIASVESLKDHYNQETLNEPKLAQLEK